MSKPLFAAVVVVLSLLLLLLHPATAATAIRPATTMMDARARVDMLALPADSIGGFSVANAFGPRLPRKG